MTVIWMWAALVGIAQAEERTEPPPFEAAPFKMPQTETLTLSNGLKVIVATNREVPLWEVRLAFRTGDFTSPDGREGLASVTMDMLNEGAGDMTAADIAAQLKLLGGSVGTGANGDGAWVSASGIRRNLEPTLDIWAKVLLEPTFPEEDWKLMKNRRLAGLADARENPTHIARRAFRRVLYGDTYLGALTNEDAYNAMTVADMKAWRGKYLGPENAVVLVGGDLSADEIEPVLEARLGSWKPEGIQTPELPASIKPVEKTRLYFIDKPGAPQSMVRVGLRIGERTADDYYALETANEIFGRLFTGRVNMNLREDKAYTYGARCYLNHRFSEGLYFCSSAIRTDATVDAVSELRREILEARGDRPLTDDEIAYAKSSLHNSFRGSFETTGPILDEHYGIWLYDLPGDWTERYLPSVQQVSTEQANAAFVANVDPEHAHWLVVGDKATVFEGLAGLGFEIIELDRDGNPISN